MIIVHHLNNSRSQRLLWLLEELSIPYEIKRYQRDAKTMLAPPELRQVHPLGKSPVITDGDKTIAESGLKTKVFPTFRPDKALNVYLPEVFNPWVDKLQAVSDTHIATLAEFVDALTKRHDFFHAMGGRLSVDSRPGRGTTFTIFLPAGEAASEPNRKRA